MGLRNVNVAIPSGDIYPNGIPLKTANPDVQATVRPEGSFFRQSVGYASIRPGRHRYQDNNTGLGIHFTPHRFAEDIGEFNSLPLLVDSETAASHADIAELPGSERLDDAGKLTASDGNAGGGVKLAEGTRAAPVGSDELHAGNRTARDMGDREPGRPYTREFYGLLRNPADAFQVKYSENPVVAIGIAGAIVGAVYFLTREFETAYRSRSRTAATAGGVTGAAAPVAAAPAAAADTAGSAVRESAEVVNEAATAAADAVEKTVSAAGDAVEAAGEAVEKTTDAVADAATGD